MDNSPVTIATYWNPVEAQLAKLHLDSAGILAYLQYEQTMVMNWLQFANLSRGIELQVRSIDSDEALTVLEQRSPSATDEEALAAQTDEVEDDSRDNDADADLLIESNCEEVVPWNEREQLIRRAYVTALIGVWFFPLHFYTLYLLGMSMLTDLPLRQESRRSGWIAAAIGGLGLLALVALANILQELPSEYVVYHFLIGSEETEW